MSRPTGSDELEPRHSADSAIILMESVALATLGLAAAYALKPTLSRLASEYYFEHIGEASPLQAAAGWYYLSSAHPPIFALALSLSIATIYASARAVVARRRG